jgi:hypothetical protein
VLWSGGVGQWGTFTPFFHQFLLGLSQRFMHSPQQLKTSPFFMMGVVGVDHSLLLITYYHHHHHRHHAIISNLKVVPDANEKEK